MSVQAPWRRWSQGTTPEPRHDVKTAQTLAELDLIALRLDVHADELERLIDGGEPERRDVRHDGMGHPKRRRSD